MSDDQNTPISGGITDLLGIARSWSVLINPLTKGVGRVLGPLAERWQNHNHIKKFDAWDEALRAKGYLPRSMELTLAERAEVRVLADGIEKQVRRESVAASAVEYAENARPGPLSNIAPPDDEWLDRFWNLAERLSVAEARNFFGTILARRAACEVTVSARALEFIALLSAEEAHALERVASHVVETFDPVTGALGVLHHLSHLELVDPAVELHEKNLALRRHVQPLSSGLLGSLGFFDAHEFGTSFRYGEGGAGAFEFRIGDRRFKATVQPQHFGTGGIFKLGAGQGFTPLGVELVKLLRPLPDETYIRLVLEGLRAAHIQVEGCESPSASRATPSSVVTGSLNSRQL